MTRLTERQKVIFSAIFRDHDASELLVAIQTETLSPDQIEWAIDLISDEYHMKGIDSDFEPTEYGREVHLLLDVINRPRLGLSAISQGMKGMNKVTTDFLDSLIGLSPVFDEPYRELTEFWMPDYPPGTIAFGKLALPVVENIDTLGPEKTREIMLLIEEGMTSSDEQLRTCVATGFIEAIIGHSERIEGGLQRMLSTFGPHSRAHADAWINFTSGDGRLGSQHPANTQILPTAFGAIAVWISRIAQKRGLK